MTSFVMPTEAQERFKEIAHQCGPEVTREEIIDVPELASKCAVAMRSEGMLTAARVFEDALPTPPSSAPSKHAWRQVALAQAALRLPKTVAALQLPDSILQLYPDLALRLSSTIIAQDKDYDIDALTRDVAHVLGLFLPAAAQDIDLNSGLPFKAFVSVAVKRGDLSLLPRYVQHGLWRTCYDVHTDSRNTKNFNPDGWLKTYRCIADLFKLRPNIPAFFGTSWFYDPALIEISPRLAYLQEVPKSGGAFFIWNGPGEIHTNRATLTSKTRRKLYEDGKYLPTCYTMVWPRQPLIEWADAQ